MPGDRWQKLANLRALYAYMWAHPGKKLLFMGGEFAQEAEWSHERSLDWHLLEQPEHAGVQALVRDLNHVYRDEPALWELDSDPPASTGSSPTTPTHNVVAFARTLDGRRARARVRGQPLAGAARALPARRCRAPGAGARLLNTDSELYGGGDVGNLGGVEAEPIPWHGQPFSAELTLPPLAASGSCPDAD